MDDSSSNQVNIRAMQPPDIDDGLRLCRASRWNQTRRDWELFLQLSPGGCRVAVKNERIIGTVTTVRYEDRFSWIGMVLVDPEERGRGVGSMLMTEAMSILSDMPSVRLDATPAGHHVYRKLDFIDEYSLSRMEAVASSEGLISPGDGVRRMTKGDLPEVASFDREVFGADRRLTLGWLLEGAPEYAWISERDGRINGYAFGRHGFNFEQAGPLIAQDQDDARRLISACLATQNGKRFIIDVSHHEADWRSWLETIGFSEQRPFIRMYCRDNPYPGTPSKQFGILGPEFG